MLCQAKFHWHVFTLTYEACLLVTSYRLRTFQGLFSQLQNGGNKHNEKFQLKDLLIRQAPVQPGSTTKQGILFHCKGRKACVPKPGGTICPTGPGLMHSQGPWVSSAKTEGPQDKQRSWPLPSQSQNVSFFCSYKAVSYHASGHNVAYKPGGFKASTGFGSNTKNKRIYDGGARGEDEVQSQPSKYDYV